MLGTSAKYFFALCFSLWCAASFTGCDEVEAPYAQKRIIADTTQQDTTELQQQVLLEEFTGIKCGQCPAATQKARELAALYPGRVHMIALHAGSFAVPRAPYKKDFRTPEGDELLNVFASGTAGFPFAMVNRTKLNGVFILGVDGWAAAIDEVLRRKPGMGIKLQAGQLQADSTMQIIADLDYRKEGNENQHLAVYIVEDSIVYNQKDYRRVNQGFTDDLDTSYVHMHMLRGSVGRFGTWGEPLGIISAGQKVRKIYTVDFRGRGWKKHNCSIIAFVHDRTLTEILQVATVHL
jgi:hypothetical protein